MEWAMDLARCEYSCPVSNYVKYLISKWTGAVSSPRSARNTNVLLIVIRTNLRSSGLKDPQTGKTCIIPLDRELIYNLCHCVRTERKMIIVIVSTCLFLVLQIQTKETSSEGSDNKRWAGESKSA